MEAINFLLKFIFDTAIMVLVLRVWLQLVRADFYNPISQFVVRVSNPIVIPVRRVIPSVAGIDLPTLILAFLVAVLNYIIVPLLNGSSLNLLLALYLGLLYLIKQVGVIIFIVMLIMAILSWVIQGYNPTQMLFHQLAEPILRPIRRFVPPIGGLDLSVLVFFLLINVIDILFNSWIPYWYMI